MKLPDREDFKKPVFVTDYPKEIKAFYMKLNEDGKTVAAMDCLVPVSARSSAEASGRTITTSLARMNELGLKPEDYGFYLDLRKYGSVRTLRFRSRLRALRDVPPQEWAIRDVIPFPRTVNNCEL